MFKKLTLAATFLFILIFLPIGVSSQTLNKIQGYVEKGGKSIRTAPTVLYKVQESYPLSTVTVYDADTVDLADIYSDIGGLLVKSNPFTSDAFGFYAFYVNTGCYDIKFSGIGILNPYTLAGVCVNNSIGIGSVTSVGLNPADHFTAFDTPITNSGTLRFEWNNQAQNLFLAAPYGSSGTPIFRDIDFDDLEASDLGSGTADNTKFLRGDRTWQTLNFITQAYDRIQDEGSNLNQRNTFNFIGSGVACVDDNLNLRTNCTFTGGVISAYDTIQEESVSLTSRTRLNFLGTGVTCIDNAGNTSTDCTINTGSITINPTDGRIPFRLNSTTFDDSPFKRIDADTVSQYNETSQSNDQVLLIHGNRPSATSYEALHLGDGSGSNFEISTVAGSTGGSLRALRISATSLSFATGVSSYTDRWQIDTSGELVPESNGAYDIGIASATIAGGSGNRVGSVNTLRLNNPTDLVNCTGITNATPTTCSCPAVSSNCEFDCQDADGCIMTMIETGNVIRGMWLTIITIGANTVTFDEDAGVNEMNGNFIMGQYDSISFRYITDRWVELGRSNN